jgi:cyclophilin family peptidyl-prolyl cis-trans isomerase
VAAPTLLIVGGKDDVVIELNRQALARLKEPKALSVIPGATHLFEQPGALDSVAQLARYEHGLAERRRHSRRGDGGRFFRVMPRFMVQFGINGDPKVSELWANARLKDDPVKQSNVKGKITFATSGPASRTTEVFINYVDNARLDKQGFAPFGEVVSGMDVVEKFYSGYGDVSPRGNGPNQSAIETQGNEYLETHFPRLDYIKKAAVE